MEIILLEHIERLGQMGDVVSVKNGYARNFLLPQRKALRKTKNNLALFETRKKEYEAHNLKLKQDAQNMAGKLKGLSAVIIRQASENGQLYGSVTARDICLATSDMGYRIERHQITLNQPIKNIGIYEIRVSLHPEVSETIEVNIARSTEEAKSALKEKETASKKQESVEADVKKEETEEKKKKTNKEK